MGYLIFIQPATSKVRTQTDLLDPKRSGETARRRRASTFYRGAYPEQWLQYLYAKMVAKDPALPAYEI